VAEFSTLALRVGGDELSGLLVVSWSDILFSFQIQRVAGFRDARSSRQRDFRDVVKVKAGDICVVGIRERLLGLNHFDVVRYSGGEAIT
jgi:hypothetical protein